MEGLDIVAHFNQYAAPQPDWQMFEASIALNLHTRKRVCPVNGNRITRAWCTVNHRKWKRSQPTVILKKTFKNACEFEDTLVSVLYSTTSTGANTRINGHVQASSTKPSWENMELVAQSVVELLIWMRIHFNIDPKLAESSQHVGVLTGLSPVHDNASFDRSLYNTPSPHGQLLNRVTEAISTVYNRHAIPLKLRISLQ